MPATPLPDLDRIDRRMLELLQEQGRMQNADLAKLVALSPSPCLRRLARLEDSAVITRYAAIVDPKKIGLGVIAHLDVMLDKQAEHARSTFRNAVQKWPEVLSGYALTGQWDYSLKVVAPDLETYSHFLMEKVLALPVVVNVQSAFVLETVKDTTALPLQHLGNGSK